MSQIIITDIPSFRVELSKNDRLFESVCHILQQLNGRHEDLHTITCSPNVIVCGGIDEDNTCLINCSKELEKATEKLEAHYIDEVEALEADIDALVAEVEELRARL